MYYLVIVACVQSACMPLMPQPAGETRESCYFEAAKQIQKWMAIDVHVREFTCREKSKHDR